uniref:Uncharacterized protein n=1 Tax=Rhizophora mucronata TaxID=61149 RepID=A0A2P2QLB4_RHIMU
MREMSKYLRFGFVYKLGFLLFSICKIGRRFCDWESLKVLPFSVSFCCVGFA